MAKVTLPWMAASVIAGLHAIAVVAMEGVTSMNAAFTPSRRKICSKVRRTEVVPAPEDPVTEMIGCLADMASPPAAPYQSRSRLRRPNSGERALRSGSRYSRSI